MSDRDLAGAATANEEGSDIDDGGLKLPDTELGYRPLQLPGEAAIFFGDLELDEELATLEILAGDGDAVEAIRCHAPILALRSTEIMKELLLCEDPPTPDEPLVLEFPEDDQRWWEKAVHWAYTNELEFELEDANDLRLFAEERGFKDLAKVVSRRISESMRSNPRKAFTIATKALEDDDKTMVKLAFEAAYQVADAIDSAAVRALPPHGFEMFIADDRASGNEVMVFRAAIEWAETLMRAVEKAGKQTFERRPYKDGATADEEAEDVSEPEGEEAADGDSVPKRLPTSGPAAPMSMFSATGRRVSLSKMRSGGVPPPFRPRTARIRPARGEGAASSTPPKGTAARPMTARRRPEPPKELGGFDVTGCDLKPVRHVFAGSAIRAAMGEAIIRQIRFPEMHPAELLLVVQPTCLLSDTEMAELVCYAIGRVTREEQEEKAAAARRAGEAAAAAAMPSGLSPVPSILPTFSAGGSSESPPRDGLLMPRPPPRRASIRSRPPDRSGSDESSDSSTCVDESSGSSVSSSTSEGSGSHGPPRGPTAEVEDGSLPDLAGAAPAPARIDFLFSAGTDMSLPDSDEGVRLLGSDSPTPSAVPTSLSGAGAAASASATVADGPRGEEEEEEEDVVSAAERQKLAALGPPGSGDPKAYTGTKSMWKKLQKRGERRLERLDRLNTTTAGQDEDDGYAGDEGGDAGDGEDEDEQEEEEEEEEEEADVAGGLGKVGSATGGRRRRGRDKGSRKAKEEPVDDRPRVLGFLATPRKPVVRPLDIMLWGGGGASGKFDNGGLGGAGGYLRVAFLLKAGEYIDVHVGEGGEASSDSSFTKMAYPNGGRGGWDHRAGGGGGASYFTSSRFGADVVAGAGGGGGGVGGRSWAAGGGGGGGTRDGKVGSKGDGHKNQSVSDIAGVDGNGDGGKSNSSGSHADGANNHGAGGKKGGSSTADGGGGGHMSCKHAKLVQSINATSHAAITCPKTGLSHGGGSTSASQQPGKSGAVVVANPVTGVRKVFVFSKTGPKVRRLTMQISGELTVTDGPDA